MFFFAAYRQVVAQAQMFKMSLKRYSMAFRCLSNPQYICSHSLQSPVCAGLAALLVSLAFLLSFSLLH